ncbi:unnamed protein product [Closterium sp. NIES-54]
MDVLTAASDNFTEAFEEQEVEEGTVWPIDHGKVLNTAEKELLRAPWTEAEIQLAIKQLPKGKAPGLDGLPKELLKENWDLLGPSFLVFVKYFECSATLPAQFTTAKTILLQKKGDKAK